MDRRLALGDDAVEEVELVEELAGLAERGRPREVEDRSGIAMGDVVEHVVGHVLADPLLALAAEMNDRRRTGELAVLAVVAGELVRLDLDRQLGEAVERGAHGRAH
jgi:hypothetical protein